ncbi:TPA: hypothetical protein ACH3X2_013140 [Trebouxia sp. C0005]
MSCYSKYGNKPAANLLERDGSWHHVAVTWTAAHNGTTKIYKDGLLMAEVKTDATEPLQSGGALMLGGDQDCYGSCTDPTQAFNGLMDEVRIWSVERSQKEIINNMRLVDGVAGQPGLVAYWKFDDPNMAEDLTGAHIWTAMDSSGNGHHLPLVTPPQKASVTINQSGRSYQTGKLKFHNNYALNEEIGGMPETDFTVEMWVRTPEYSATAEAVQRSELLSYATHTVGDSSGRQHYGGVTDHAFVDDAILIEKYYVVDMMLGQGYTPLSTISVSVNANPRVNEGQLNHWMNFDVDWKDNKWHHVAVTWSCNTGKTEVFFDGIFHVPTWRTSEGQWQSKAAKDGGVDPHMAPQTLRLGNGSLVLGQNQDCYGGCFDPQTSFDGDLADVRMWDQVLPQERIVADMFTASLSNSSGLVVRYDFSAANIKQGTPGANGIARSIVVDSARGSPDKALYLWSDAPRFEVSTAPLADREGQAVQLPDTFYGDHALFLSDQQVLLVTNFHDFPATAVTVEFWMWSVDNCNQGVPFSYAAGAYSQGDNAFLIYNYNNWEIDIMEDQGSHGDRNAGFGSTDGQWHHIAVTWESSTGIATLYLDGRKAWSTVRAQGMRIPSGGTLVVGREQDCMGGCFDSAQGAAGDVQQRYQLEYGAQDFTGVIDELRIWKTVRSQGQIQQGMASDLKRAEPSTEASDRVSPSDPDLVAYWTFEEGSGYLVKDVTAHKHDLHIQQPPQWRVVGPQQVCGNGIVEGLEQCDDGDSVGADGCSATCQVEEGYECSGLQPSTCWPAHTHPNTAATDAVDRRSGKNSHGLFFLIGAVVTAAIIGSAALIYAAGDIIANQWATISPSLPSFGPISGSLAGLAWPLWGRGGEGYSGLAMADTELYSSAEGGGAISDRDAPANPYQAPESAPLLQDPQSFPAGP